MSPQLELPITKQIDIPEAHFNCFKACNAYANGWVHRERFYRLKRSILESRGRADGHDLQILQMQCYSCHGTGDADQYTHCDRCRGTGIHKTVAIALSRYILNDEVFYIPQGRVDPRTLHIDYTDEVLQARNTIHGYITHEFPVAINPVAALATLILEYEPNTALSLVTYQLGGSPF